MAVSSAARSTTSGSRAQFSISVSPSARTAAISRSSVPVTVILSKTMCAPRRRVARASRYPCSWVMVAPIFSRPLMCRSMGLPPMAHPPGMATRAMPVRAISGPEHEGAGAHGFYDFVVRDRVGKRAATDGGAVLRRVRSPARPRRPWRPASRRSVSMSRTWGMFSSVTSSSVRMAAAMHGSAEFFAPETRMVPTSGLPPRMTNLSMGKQPLASSR